MNFVGNNISLVEDHDEVLKIWQKQSIRRLDLVHLDAHIDFGFYPAKPLEKLVQEAGSIQDLKRKLEYALNFLHYEKDFNKQINLGNYIYPAIEEEIVNNFYWVIPGKLQEFKKSAKAIKRILKQVTIREGKQEISYNGSDIITAKYSGRKIIVCNLESLPILTKPVLLDIDVDFLIIDSILNSDNTQNVGKRKPWILPQGLFCLLKEKIKLPRITTIAYSVNGGFTPLKYKYLGDELAFKLSPLEFKDSFKVKQEAGRYFNFFDSTGKKEYYRKAIRLNPLYRCADNNYGPLYLTLRKFFLAQKEFKKILKVDKFNPGAILGRGEIALQRNDFKKAKKCFSLSLRLINHGLFAKIKQQALAGLAKAEFNLSNFKRAKKLLLTYQSVNPLDPESYYLLGYIFEKEREFSKAALFYQDAIRLGFGSIGLFIRLLKISRNIQEKDDIIKFLIARYREFKKGFVRVKRLGLKNGKKIIVMCNVEKRIAILEKRLCKLNQERSPCVQKNSPTQKYRYGNQSN